MLWSVTWRFWSSSRNLVCLILIWEGWAQLSFFSKFKLFADQVPHGQNCQMTCVPIASPGHVDMATSEEISSMGSVQVPFGKPSWWNLIIYFFCKPHPTNSFKGIPMSCLQYNIPWRSLGYLVYLMKPLDTLLTGGGCLSTWGTMVPQLWSQQCPLAAWKWFLMPLLYISQCGYC